MKAEMGGTGVAAIVVSMVLAMVLFTLNYSRFSDANKPADAGATCAALKDVAQRAAIAIREGDREKLSAMLPAVPSQSQAERSQILAQLADLHRSCDCAELSPTLIWADETEGIAALARVVFGPLRKAGQAEQALSLSLSRHGGVWRVARVVVDSRDRQLANTKRLSVAGFTSLLDTERATEPTPVSAQ